MNSKTTSTPWENALKLQADVAHQYMTKVQLLQNLMQVMNGSTISNTTPNIENSSPSTLWATPQNNIIPFEGSPGSEIQNQLGIDPFGPSDSQAINPNLWASGEDSRTGGRESFDLQKNSDDNEGHHHEGIHDEKINQLPGLVSDPFTGTSSSNHMENKSDHSATTSLGHSTIFEAWEKLMDDETSESYWKDIFK